MESLKIIKSLIDSKLNKEKENLNTNYDWSRHSETMEFVIQLGHLYEGYEDCFRETIESDNLESIKELLDFRIKNIGTIEDVYIAKDILNSYETYKDTFISKEVDEQIEVPSLEYQNNPFTHLRDIIGKKIQKLDVDCDEYNISDIKDLLKIHKSYLKAYKDFI